MGKPSARSSSYRARSSTSSSERRAARLAAVILLAALTPLAGCGFAPLYGERAGTEATVSKLASVDVSVAETALGRTLKYNLLDRLSESGAAPAGAAYQLVLTPTSYSQDVAIQQNAAVTRANFVLVVPFKLVDMATGKTVLKSTARSRTSYNRSESEFANLTSAREAEKRTAEAIADDIKLQLSVFFDRQATAALEPR